MVLSCDEIKKNYPDCVTSTNGQQVQVMENKRKYILKNLSAQKKL